MLSFFAQEQSFSQHYLEGFANITKLCHQKMGLDLAIVLLKVSDLDVVKVSRELQMSLRDRTGLIGM